MKGQIWSFGGIFYTWIFWDCEKIVPSIHSVYLPENENIVEPEDIGIARKIDQTFKIDKLERKYSLNGDTYINFFKIADDEDPFHVQGYGGKNEIICGHVKPVKMMMCEIRGKLQWSWRVVMLPGMSSMVPWRLFLRVTCLIPLYY